MLAGLHAAVWKRVYTFSICVMDVMEPHDEVECRANSYSSAE
jgi:hypothetical protein